MKIQQLLTFLFLFSFETNAQQIKSTTSISLLIFDDSQKIKIYKDTKKTIYKCIANDSLKEDYFTITILKKYKRLYLVSANSVLHKISGYITGENLGIYTRPRNFLIKLFEFPKHNSKEYLINQEDGIMVKVIQIEAPWLKVTFTINGENYTGWLPSEYQCPNPYSTCN
ncbi:MAG: hypothetical protein RL555_67 [Bacteroidota bacterium]|jgi:hypothetical protein